MSESPTKPTSPPNSRTHDRASDKTPTGEFSEPLAAAHRGLEALRNLVKRPGTVGNFPQVDGLAGGSSAFVAWTRWKSISDHGLGRFSTARGSARRGSAGWPWGTHTWFAGSRMAGR